MHFTGTCSSLAFFTGTFHQYTFLLWVAMASIIMKVLTTLSSELSFRRPSSVDNTVGDILGKLLIKCMTSFGIIPQRLHRFSHFTAFSTSLWLFVYLVFGWNFPFLDRKHIPFKVGGSNPDIGLWQTALMVKVIITSKLPTNIPMHSHSHLCSFFIW